jgi:hypothetical protein
VKRVDLILHPAPSRSRFHLRPLTFRLSVCLVCHRRLQYNRRNSGQQRVLVLTSTAIYNFIPKKYELRRRIAIQDLRSVSLSRLCTDLIVLHHATEHDYLLTSPKRPELMYHLQAAFKRLSNGMQSLPYDFSERLYVADKENRMRDIQILDSQSFKLGKAFEAQGMP